jgi:hypothetical protein
MPGVSGFSSAGPTTIGQKIAAVVGGVIVFGSVIAILFSANFKDSSAQNGSREYVKITSISPPITQPLHVGQTVEVSIDVTYQLNAQTGTVGIITQASDTTPISQDMTVINKGQGTQKLTTRFVVPKTKAIEVLSTVFHEGEQQSSVVDSRYMKVEP